VRRIGIFGGTFDPIHSGHVDIGAAAAASLNLTRLFLVPARIPPHRPRAFASRFHRFAMAALTVAGRPVWRVSDLELREDGPSYTSTTLKRFHERGYPASELFFVIGADAFADIASWKDYPRLLECAHFAVVSRPGLSVEELPRRLPHLARSMITASAGGAAPATPSIILIDARTADVSSTAIRKRRAEGQTIAGLVEPSVQQHIEQHGLYTPMDPGRRGNDAPPRPAAGRLHGEK
jgi:nicotinate-nucleotide adenylyltransferase